VNKIELNTKSDINDVYIKELEKVIEKHSKKS
jgi:hypothetical protein